MCKRHQIHTCICNIKCVHVHALCLTVSFLQCKHTSHRLKTSYFRLVCQRINDDSLHDVWTWINRIAYAGHSVRYELRGTLSFCRDLLFLSLKIPASSIHYMQTYTHTNTNTYLERNQRWKFEHWQCWLTMRQNDLKS